MKVLECRKNDEKNHDNIFFIRIDPEDLSVTLREIIESFSDLSWISKFDKKYIRTSFAKRAETSAKYLAKQLQNGKDLPDVIFGMYAKHIE